PRLEVEKTGSPTQMPLDPPALLDPRDRTAAANARPWAYSLIAWPEPADGTETARAATVRTAETAARIDGDVELVAPIRNQASSREFQPLAEEHWDDSGWHSAR